MPIAPGGCAAGRTLSFRAALGRLAGARRPFLQPLSPAHAGRRRTGTAGYSGAGRVEIGAWLAKRQTLSATLLLVLGLHLWFFSFQWGKKDFAPRIAGPYPQHHAQGRRVGWQPGTSLLPGQGYGRLRLA